MWKRIYTDAFLIDCHTTAHFLCHSQQSPQLPCGGLQGIELKLPFPSVGATENVVLAAVTAEGTTVLEHAAKEPEIEALCGFLRYCPPMLQNSPIPAKDSAYGKRPQCGGSF